MYTFIVFIYEFYTPHIYDTIQYDRQYTIVTVLKPINTQYTIVTVQYDDIKTH